MKRNDVEEIMRHIDAQGAALREEMAAQGAELRQEIAAQGTSLGEGLATQAMALRGLQADLEQRIGFVADGVALANERLDSVDNRVDQLTTEVRRGFAAVRADIRGLNQADDRLAVGQEELRSRVERLESDRRP